MRHLSLALLLVLGGVPLLAQNPVLDSIQVLGGSGSDTVVSIAPDGAGNIFVLGSTQSSDFPATATFGASTTPPTNGRDTFVAKIRLSDWSLTWAVVIQPTVPLSLAIDNTGAVYVSGYTAPSGNFPATPGAFTTTDIGPWDQLFIVKLDPTGARIVYAAQIAAYALYTGAPIAVDSQGQVYIAASGTGGPVTPGALYSTGPAYVAKLSADGSTIIFCTYLDSGGSTTPSAIAVDGERNVFVAGVDAASGSAFPSTPGVVQPNHAGPLDSAAFLMKFSPDGTKLELATLLGGTGGNSAEYLQVAADGAIYIAGYCENGSSASPATPFPTTAKAAFRTFNTPNGFVAKLSPDASSLLFSTYASNASNSGVSGFAIAGGQIHAAYLVTVSQGFWGPNLGILTKLPATAVQTFDSETGAATAPVFQVPALTPDGFTASGTDLVIASNASQINLPVPSTTSPIGPLGPDPYTSPHSESDITLGRFLIGGTPDHDINADRGSLLFDKYPGATLQQILNVTSSAGSFPFHIFGPPPACCQPVVPAFDISPPSGLTPAAVTVSEIDAIEPSYSATPALLLVAPHASQPIRILPADTDCTYPQVPDQYPGLTLPAGGGPATGTFQVSASVTCAFATIPVSEPFQIDPFSVPAFIDIHPLQGTTPATINVTAQLDSLPPGQVESFNVSLTANSYTKPYFAVSLFRAAPAPPVLVTPTYVYLNVYADQPPVTRTLQVTPPDNNTRFQVSTLPAGIAVIPTSGTGSMPLSLTVDPSRFSVGSPPVNFTIQVGSSPISVEVVVVVTNPFLAIRSSAATVAPGLRWTLDVASGALPTIGYWADVSPAPTDWNGYSFVYRSQKLPILSANPSTAQFDIQFPYNLDLTGQGEPVTFVAPDNTVIASSSTRGTEQPTDVSTFFLRTSNQTAFKQDGSAVSSANPVIPGDTFRLPIVGAGVTSPPISAGLLPPPNTTISPTALIPVAIGALPAAVVQQVLDPQLIGVTNLYIEVPDVASGLEMVGLQSGSGSAILVPIWVVGATGQASQTITFGALTDEPLGTPPITLSALASSGLPVSYAPQTGAVCAISGAMLSLLTAGTCTIQATQTGNATFLPAPSVTQSFPVTAATKIACIGTGATSRLSAVQSIVQEALGGSIPANDLNADGALNIVDVQIMTNWAVGMGCISSH